MTKKELDHLYWVEQKDTESYKRRRRRTQKKYRESRQGIRRKIAWNGASRSQINQNLKIEVLSHYGPKGCLQCSWPDCSISDVDMLSLDHLNNDGAKDRHSRHRGRGGVVTYARVRKAGFPDGFQTLCHNHQWKKELMRRREMREQNGKL